MNGPAGQLMSGIFEIVLAIVGIGLFALLLNPKANTVGVVNATGTQLSNLLNVVTLQR